MGFLENLYQHIETGVEDSIREVAGPTDDSIERQGYECRHCGGTYTSESASAYCCEDE